MDSRISLGRITLDNPVLGAAGCVMHGYEMAEYTDVTKIGAFSTKTITLQPRKGNPPPRIVETQSGFLNSGGLQNPGADAFIKEEWPKIKNVLRPDQIIISIAAHNAMDYGKLAEKIAEICDVSEIAALEVNGACPNVEKGGMISSSVTYAKEVLNLVKKVVDFPIILKMNVCFDNYCEVAKAAELAGIDALYTTFGVMGMTIDTKRKKCVLGNRAGGIVGPSSRPGGVFRVWNLYDAINIPIIASGGIYDADDAVQYMLAGASAVGIGSAIYQDPNSMIHILGGLQDYAQREKITSFADMVGIAHKN